MSKRHPNTDTTFILSPRWSAPELFKTRILTFETDIWALGCTFVELFNNGAKPFEGIPTKQLEHDMRQGEHITPEIDPSQHCPGEIMCLLESMFRRDPHNRPTARQVYQHMETFYTKITTLPHKDPDCESCL